MKSTITQLLRKTLLLIVILPNVLYANKDSLKVIISVKPIEGNLKSATENTPEKLILKDAFKNGDVAASDFHFSFKGASSGTVELISYSFPNDLWQKMVYSLLDVSFTIEANFVQEFTDDLLKFNIVKKNGTIHFIGEVSKKNFGATEIYKFNRFQNFNDGDVEGTAYYSLSKKKITYLNFSFSNSSEYPFAKSLSYVNDTIKVRYILPPNAGFTTPNDIYDVINPSFDLGNQFPTANFTFSPKNPVAGEPIVFDASSSKDPDGGNPAMMAAQWDFGDGTTGTGKNAKHTYKAPGEYNVCLTIIDIKNLRDKICRKITVTSSLCIISEIKAVGNNINPILEVPDNIIWKQEFADCNPIVKISGPFSAPRNTTVKLYTKLSSCPIPLENLVVGYTYRILNKQIQIGDSDSFEGEQGEVKFITPSEVGEYDVELTYVITGNGFMRVEPIELKLFVTYDHTRIPDAKREWYEIACAWGEGQSKEDAIVEQVNNRIYKNGQSKWNYFSCGNCCSWKSLISNSINCNYGNCYTFSGVLQNICLILGIDNFKPETEKGSKKLGFITKKDLKSIDPKFIGNAKPLTVLPDDFDRFYFIEHRLVKKGNYYYDPTFGDRYTTRNKFIEWNISSVIGKTYFYTTEGVIIVRDFSKNSYNNWGYQVYNDILISNKSAKSKGIEFTNETINFTIINEDGNNMNESLRATGSVEIHETGEYLISGELVIDGHIISDRPYYESLSYSENYISGDPGIYDFYLNFSGEQIFESGLDGPYDFKAYAISINGLEDSIEVSSPAYLFSEFGEKQGRITGVSEKGLDEDENGKNEILSVSVDFSIDLIGNYNITVSLGKDSISIESINQSNDYEIGNYSKTFNFSGYNIINAKLDGPYDIVINLYNVDNENVDSKSDSTKFYTTSDFENKILDINGIYNYHGIDNNNNGKYEFLYFDFQAEVKYPGLYNILCKLKDTVNNTEFVFADTLMNLSVGLGEFSVFFPGSPFYNGKYDAPYIMNKIEISDTSSNVLELILTDYKITGFKSDDFDHYEVLVNYADTFYTSVSDTNSNELYDFLQVDIGVVSSRSGVLLGTADLYDRSGNKITSANGYLEVNAGDTVFFPLQFDGRYIYGNLRNGKYQIKNVYIYHSGDVYKGERIAKLGFTDSYAYTEFEQTPVITGIVYDLLHNGRFGAGTLVSCGDSYDYVSNDGSYNLILLNDGEYIIKATYYDAVPDTLGWLVYQNGEFVGYQDSAIVNVQKSKIDTVDFILPVSIDTTICMGMRYFIGDKYYTEKGIYYDTIQSTTNADSILITNLEIYPVFNVVIDTSLCEGKSYFAQGNWQTMSGTYKDTLFSVNGCDSTIITNVFFHPKPNVYLGPDTILFIGDTLNLDAGDSFISYLWDNDSHEQFRAIYGTTVGDFKYSVQATDINNCSNSDTIIVKVAVTSAVADLKDNEKIYVYPNPTKGVVTLIPESEINSEISISVFNNAGKILYFKKVQHFYLGDKLKIDLTNYPNGIYYLKINNSKIIKVKKVVKI